MKTIARLVTRLQGEGDGLMFGAAFKDHNFFEPNTIYEIVEVYGETVIRKLGKSAVAETGETVQDSPIRQHWACDAGDILAISGPYLFMTREEVAELNKRGENE